MSTLVLLFHTLLLWVDPINSLIIWCRGTQATAPIQNNASTWAHSSAWGNQKQGLVACAQDCSEVLKLIPRYKVLLAHLALWWIVGIHWLPPTTFFFTICASACVMWKWSEIVQTIVAYWEHSPPFLYFIPEHVNMKSFTVVVQNNWVFIENLSCILPKKMWCVFLF